VGREVRVGTGCGLSAPAEYLSDLVAKCLVRPTAPGGVPLVRKIQNLQRLGLDVETLWPFVKVRPLPGGGVERVGGTIGTTEGPPPEEGKG